MNRERVFTAEELRLGSLRSVDALAEALARGDRESAARFGRRQRREVLSMKGNYDNWEATLLGWVREHHGEAGETDALTAIVDSGGPLPEVAGVSGGVDFESRWRALASEVGTLVEDGRDDEALTGAQALHAEALAYHDRGMARVNALLSWIGRSYGAESLEEAYIESMAGDMLGDAGYRERAEALMHFTRIHLQSFSLTEDDEKLTFECSVCPSGGRLIQAGHFEGPDAALHVEGPSWLTWGRGSLPVYCCHEPIMERASMQKTGVPLFVVDPPEDLGRSPCPTYLYKDPADIPERFYTRLGLEKPKSG